MRRVCEFVYDVVIETRCMEDSIKESTDNACCVVVLFSGAPRERVRFVYVPGHRFVVVVVVQGKKGSMHNFKLLKKKRIT